MDLQQQLSALQATVFDLTNRYERKASSTSSSTEQKAEERPYWTGVILPNASSVLPAVGTDWDSYFDDYSATKYAYNEITILGELKTKFIYFAPGDIRFRMVFDCPNAQDIPAYLFFGGTSTLPASYDVQLKLNGVLNSYTAVVGDVSRTALTLKFVKGRNVLSLALNNGTQILDLYCSFLGDFAAFVKE